MSTTTGRTGYTSYTNGDPMDGPAQITATAKHFDDLIDLAVSTYSSLPTTGNWQGRRVITLDTGIIWFHNGTTWVAVPKSGLIPCVPSSTAGSGSSPTIDVNGKVTFTVGQSAAAIGLNGVFSAAFTRYKILITTSSAADVTGVTNTDLFFNFTTGGTPNTATNYYGGQVGNSQNVWNVGNNAGHGRVLEFTLRNPFQSQFTEGICAGSTWDSASGGMAGVSRPIGFAGGTSFDGFAVNFALPSGRSAGEIQVFGFID